MILTEIQNRSLIIRSNYGDESIALTQWVFEAGLTAQVVYIDTGWAASSWTERVQLGEAHAKHCGFEVVSLVSPITFKDAVLGRREFPSAELLWCTGLLKGLPFLDWLETVDLAGEYIILLAKRKVATTFHANLEEWLEHCQYHGDRKVWHPLLAVSNLERDALLARAGFLPLEHRSLECEPCVNSSCADLKRISNSDKQKQRALELAVNSSWALSPPEVENYLDLFYRGCGNHFGCGM
jgi:hypothetical protein